MPIGIAVNIEELMVALQRLGEALLHILLWSAPKGGRAHLVIGHVNCGANRTFWNLAVVLSQERDLKRPRGGRVIIISYQLTQTHLILSAP